MESFKSEYKYILYCYNKYLFYVLILKSRIMGFFEVF